MKSIAWLRLNVIAWLLVLASVGTVSSARAQTADPSLTKEGIELRRAGRDAEALAVFERALAIDGSPRTRAQVGLAEQALGLWVEAERDLSTALAAGEGSWFEQHQRTLRSALDAIRSRLGTLEVEADVRGAELWIRGSRAGVLPLEAPLRVVAGTVAIEVRAPGFATQVRSVEVAPLGHAREVVNLARVPGQEAPAAVATPPPALLGAPPARSARRAAEDGTGMRIGAWVSLGSAVVLLAGAGVGLLVHNTNAAIYNDDRRCFYGGPTRDQRCGSYRDTASTAQTLAVLGFEAAAAAVGLSVVLFTLAPRARDQRVGEVECSVGMGVACGGLFR
jgi:hypothetical protein